MSKMPTT